MKRIRHFATMVAIAGALYSGFVDPVFAQNITCPTRPLGDTTNACASTAFVQNAVSAPPLTSTHIFVGNASNVAGDFGTLAVFSTNGQFTMSPTAATLTKAFEIIQSGPTSGSTGVEFAFNRIVVSGEAINTTLASEVVNTLRITHTFGGANASGARAALQVDLNLNSATSSTNNNRNYVAGYFNVNTSSGDGGTNTGVGAKGNITVLNPVVRANNAPNLSGIAGMEIDVVTSGTTTVAGSIGALFIRGGTVQAAGTVDAALLVSSGGATFGGTIAWKQGLYFTNNGGSAPAFATTGCFICTDGAADTASMFAEAYAFNFTDYIFRFKNLSVTGAGQLTAASFILSSTAVANTAGFQFNDGTVGGVFLASSFLTNSAAIGTTSASPIAFITNNALRGSVSSAGIWNIGLTGTLTGQMGFSGATSGTATITAQAIAGTPTLTLPNASGTFAISATAPLAVSATTGNITCTTCTTSAASLTSNQLVIGSGTQTMASLGTLGTTTTVLHGNAGGAPTFAAVSLTADVSGILPGTNGGTGVNNASRTITTGGNITFAGAFATTITATATTNSTLPAGTDTLGGLATAQTWQPTSGSNTFKSSTTFSLIVKGAVAGANYVQVDTAGASQQAGIYLYDNGVGEWLFAKNTDQTFSFFDVISSVDQIKVTQGTGTTGIVSIAGQTKMAGMASDTATTDNTVCVATSGGQLLKGTGASGICLGTSGRQFKTDFSPMVVGLDEVAKIKLWNYRYLPSYGDSGARQQYGSTAQDMADAIPDLVRYNEKGEAINFDIGALIPISIHAIQQLKADNDNLRWRIEKMEAAK